MELKGKIADILPVLKKYKYTAIILAVGLILMILPTGREGVSNDIKSIQTAEPTAPSLESQLSQVLSTVEGVGEVQIILTVAEGEEIIYQTDISNNQTDTVTVTDAGRDQTGLIRQVNPNRYLGAIVVCQGGDNPAVRLAVVDAVSKATGLGANQISILKMK